MKKKAVAIRNRIIIQEITTEVRETTDSGLLFIPEANQEDEIYMARGIVISVGEQVTKEIKEGDIVAFDRRSVSIVPCMDIATTGKMRS